MELAEPFGEAVPDPDRSLLSHQKFVGAPT